MGLEKSLRDRFFLKDSNIMSNPDFPKQSFIQNQSPKTLIIFKKPKITQILVLPKISCLELLMKENFPNRYVRKKKEII